MPTVLHKISFPGVSEQLIRSICNLYDIDKAISIVKRTYHDNQIRDDAIKAVVYFKNTN